MKVEASPVPETARRDASALGSCMQRKFVPAPIWTEAMLAALQTGVKGGKWHKQWPNAFFADLGLFTMYEAHQLARQSR
jgi:RNA-directed DNA polymerase